jgi:hypothetical protein
MNQWKSKMLYGDVSQIQAWNRNGWGIIIIIIVVVVIIISAARLSPLGTAVIIGLLYQPQMIDDGDCRATGGMKFGRGNWSTQRNLPQCPFVHYKSHMTWPGLEHGPPLWEAGY